MEELLGHTLAGAKKHESRATGDAEEAAIRARALRAEERAEEEQTGYSLDSLQTGDVLLYRTLDAGGTFVRCMMRSFYSHVSLVVRVPRDRVIDLYDADYVADEVSSRTSAAGARSELHVFEAVPNRGVSFFPLEPRLARTVNHSSHIAVRRLCRADAGDPPSFGADQQERLEGFIREVCGRPLETGLNSPAPWAACLHAYFRSGAKVGWLSSKLGEDFERFFCTELVAEALQRLCAPPRRPAATDPTLPRMPRCHAATLPRCHAATLPVSPACCRRPSGVLRDDVFANDFLPNSFTHASRGPLGSPLALSLDAACEPGYRYAAECLLVSRDAATPRRLADRGGGGGAGWSAAPGGCNVADKASLCLRGGGCGASRVADATAADVAARGGGGEAGGGQGLALLTYLIRRKRALREASTSRALVPSPGPLASPPPAPSPDDVRGGAAGQSQPRVSPLGECSLTVGERTGGKGGSGACVYRCSLSGCAEALAVKMIDTKARGDQVKGAA